MKKGYKGNVHRFRPLDFIHILIVPDSAVTSYERYIHIIFIVA